MTDTAVSILEDGLGSSAKEADTQPGKSESNAHLPTPGPWGLTISEPPGQWVLYSKTAVRPGSKGLCDAGRYIGSEANARLIAAAPEMYTILYEMFCDGPLDVAFAGNPEVIAAFDARVRDVIDKATPTPASIGG